MRQVSMASALKFALQQGRHDRGTRGADEGRGLACLQRLDDLTGHGVRGTILVRRQLVVALNVDMLSRCIAQS